MLRSLRCQRPEMSIRPNDDDAVDRFLTDANLVHPRSKATRFRSQGLLRIKPRRSGLIGSGGYMKKFVAGVSHHERKWKNFEKIANSRSNT